MPCDVKRDVVATGLRSQVFRHILSQIGKQDKKNFGFFVVKSLKTCSLIRNWGARSTLELKRFRPFRGSENPHPTPIVSNVAADISAIQQLEGIAVPLVPKKKGDLILKPFFRRWYVVVAFVAGGDGFFCAVLVVARIK